MGKLSFFFKEAFGSLKRNYFMTIAALVTVFLSVMVLGVVLVLVFTTSEMLGQVEKKVQINVWFNRDPDPSPDQMSQAQETIKSWPEVENVAFVTKEEGWDEMEETFQDNPGVLDAVSGNIFPNKLEVALVDPTQVDAVAAKIVALDTEHAWLEEVDFEEDTAEKLFAMTSQIRNILAGFIVLLGIVSILLISNTIRLSIFARKREVEIMKLVGATNWFIRWPFIIEGITVGLFGAAAAAATVLLVNSYGMAKVRDVLGWMAPAADAVPTTMVGLLLLGMGVFIGAIGSALGLRRLLKV